MGCTHPGRHSASGASRSCAPPGGEGLLRVAPRRGGGPSKPDEPLPGGSGPSAGTLHPWCSPPGERHRRSRCSSWGSCRSPSWQRPGVFHSRPGPLQGSVPLPSGDPCRIPGGSSPPRGGPSVLRSGFLPGPRGGIRRGPAPPRCGSTPGDGAPPRSSIPAGIQGGSPPSVVASSGCVPSSSHLPALVRPILLLRSSVSCFP